ncbi:PLP-dependent aminotransferase family protein [Agromyces sp. SYSU K20354]|uniref:MocR-like pyridoxine biosynthesis transcription factor PdxR n=1 Tax=Agromyces cavernae TaxID=2898659 RepID=UPI001E38C247|nr:PLP-dependent aminotransferase family protein [Agromyces cavernae]MCD2440743.1 PLP-dependent aminotransferase family protein [Agromyces cavernae]
MDGPLLVIDRAADIPIGVQLVEGVRRGILGGLLRPGDPMPSTRSFAAELGVSRSAVVAAYEQLAGEGYLEMRQGAPTRVAHLARQGARAARNGVRHVASARASSPISPRVTPSHHAIALESTISGDSSAQGDGEGTSAPRIDLRPGRPSTARLDTRAWRAAWRHAAALEVPSDSPPRFGVPRLRAEIADHLRHARGVICSADDIVVTAGTGEAVGLIAASLPTRAGGPPTVAVEHPGYPSARRIIEHRRVRTVAVPVDGDGISIEHLRRMSQPVDAVMVTPSHQYPLGGRLPVADRLALIDWAREADALVIEDDYDSEFRHLGPPLPALASLDDEGRVVLLGSFSKVLTPALRLGYLVLPPNPELRAAIAAMRADENCPVPGVAQEAAAALLASGAVRRHIAVTSRDYAHRRRLVQAALGDLPAARLSGLDGGLHAVIEFDAAGTSDAVVSRLARDGVAVARLADYSVVPGDEREGVVFGYASPSDSLLAESLALMHAAILDRVGGSQ